MDEDTTSRVRNAEILKMRDAGAGWQEISDRFGLTRQQARYAYQIAKRAQRRAARRATAPEP